LAKNLLEIWQLKNHNKILKSPFWKKRKKGKKANLVDPKENAEYSETKDD
jgi:hypothetical protein